MDTNQQFWLQTTFQNSLEVSLQLSRSPAPEETPFKHKYQAIQILKQLLEVEHKYKFIVLCVLGQIYSDVEQINDSIKAYQSALISIAVLPSQQIPKFYQYLIVIYNMLGISYLNRDQKQQGLGCIIKAHEVYEAFTDIKGQDVYHNRSFEAKGRQFHYFYEGGNDHEQIEDTYTLTLFYFAQIYTKLDFKQKAAEYCGLTLQRQHTSGKYEIKDFVNNLIGLAEYYQGNKYFSQAQYLYMLALKTLPEGRKKKLRASVNISIGNLIGDILQFSCLRIENSDINEGDNAIVMKEILLFKEFDQAFPKIILPTEIEGCKSLFRQANTQFKKALQIFVLDGFVTEHIQILFSQSKLYKSLARLQKSNERKLSMLEKRRQILEPLLKELNPKAYPATWQKILVQVSEIVNDLFSLKVALLGAKGYPSQQKINQSCELGKKAIYYYKQMITAIKEDKDSEQNEQYFRSLINCHINIAKATSKLMSSDRKKRVEYLKEAWQLYQKVLDFMKKEVKQQFRECFEKEIELTNEMIAMLPNKIDKVNYGQLSYID